jgi:hypothetical protein
LTVTARAYGPALPVRVDVLVNDSPIGSFSPGADWQNYELPVPRSVFSESKSIVEFRFDHTARPRDHEAGSRDDRELAVRFDQLLIVR